MPHILTLFLAYTCTLELFSANLEGVNFGSVAYNLGPTLTL